MNGVKIGLLVFLIILVAIQFIQVPANNQVATPANRMSQVIHVPDSIQSILQIACYDCHSNNTRYPWYGNIQPMAWWMASHIKEGKAELNFDEFGTYSKRRQVSKLKAIQGSIEDESMPLPSYRFIHRESEISKKDQEGIKKWIDEAKHEILKL